MTEGQPKYQNEEPRRCRECRSEIAQGLLCMRCKLTILFVLAVFVVTGIASFMLRCLVR